MPVESLGTDGIASVVVCGVVVLVAAIVPVLLAGPFDTGTIEGPLLLYE